MVFQISESPDKDFFSPVPINTLLEAPNNEINLPNTTTFWQGSETIPRVTETFETYMKGLMAV